MIDQNLYFLNSFLQETNIQLIARLESKLCPAEELGLQYSRAVEKEQSSNSIFLMQVNPRVLKILTPKEKERIYTLLRIFSIQYKGSWSFLFMDYNNLLQKRGFASTRYFYLESLTDSYFCYEIDCILTKGTPSRRSFYREMSSKYCRNTLNLQELLLKYFTIKLVEVKKKKNKRLIRHKGYRDHGSLGTGSRTLNRDIQSDVWFQEKERLRKKQTSDLIEFLHGLNGSI